MGPGDIEVFTKLLDSQSGELKQFINTSMAEMKLHIAESSSVTDKQIAAVNSTLKDHNGRLKHVEDDQEKLSEKVEKQSRAYHILTFLFKHWYLTAAVIVLLILLLVPVVEILGLKGIINTFK